MMRFPSCDDALGLEREYALRERVADGLVRSFPGSRTGRPRSLAAAWAAALGVWLLAATVGAAPLPMHPTVPDTMPGTLELDVLPRPAKEDLRAEVFKVGRCRFLVDDGVGYGIAQLTAALGPFDLLERVASVGELPHDDPSTLVVVGLANWREARGVLPWMPEPPEALGEQEYRLTAQAGTGDRPNLIIAAGGSVPADFFAVQSLVQLIYRSGRESFARLGTIEDAPAFGIRGNKRFVSWMGSFKANMVNPHAFYLGVQDSIPFVHRFREYHPISFPPKPPKDVMHVAANVEGMLNITPTPEQEASLHPVAAFMMDDVEKTDAVSDEDRAEYGGYFQSIHAVLSQSAAAMHEKNPAVRIFFMPQFYFSHMRDFTEGGRILRESGPFPPNVGVFFNGAEVSSIFFPEAMVTDYLQNLGAPEGTPVLIYDTVFDTDESVFPVPKLDPGVAKYIEGFVPEMGNPINMATYYDMLWNPAGYDRERSGLLACREVMGLEKWPLLKAACDAYERLVLPPPPSVPREEALARLDAAFKDLKAATDVLMKFPAADLEGRVNFSVLFERKNRRMFGEFDIADFVLTRRPLTVPEIEMLQAGRPDSLPAADVVASMSVEEEGKLTALGGRALRIGPINTGQGPGERQAVSFPGYPGTGIQLDLDEIAESPNGWAASWWMRISKVERICVVFQIFEDATFANKIAEAASTAIEPGQLRQNAGRLFSAGGLLTPPNALADGDWHHITLNVTPEGLMTCFLDGVEVGASAPGKTALPLAGKIVVLGGVPAPVGEISGVRGILRSWGDFVAHIDDVGKWVEKNRFTLDKFFARRIAAPFVEDGKDFTKAARDTGFVPSSRPPPGEQMGLEALHNAESIALRASGPVPQNGMIPQVQFYLDPSADRTMALQLNIPASKPGEDGARDFVEEGVGAEGAWAAFFSQANKPPQYTDFPTDWKWSRKVENGTYEVTAIISKASLRQAIGGADLPASIGLQVFNWTRPWNTFLLWRGRIDPATYGTLDLLPQATSDSAAERLIE